jgi:hypothetical protein
MLVKIIKHCFIYILFPQGLFFYGFYFNDFLDVDLFNMKKIANLSTEISEIKDFIKAQNEISNKKLEDIQKVSFNSNIIGFFILTVVVVFGICYLGYNYFDDGSSSLGTAVVETVEEIVKPKKIFYKIDSRPLVSPPDIPSDLLNLKISDHLKALDLKESTNAKIEILKKCNLNSSIMKEFFQIKK